MHRGCALLCTGGSQFESVGAVEQVVAHLGLGYGVLFHRGQRLGQGVEPDSWKDDVIVDQLVDVEAGDDPVRAGHGEDSPRTVLLDANPVLIVDVEFHCLTLASRLGTVKEWII